MYCHVFMTHIVPLNCIKRCMLQKNIILNHTKLSKAASIKQQYTVKWHYKWSIATTAIRLEAFSRKIASGLTKGRDTGADTDGYQRHVGCHFGPLKPIWPDITDRQMKYSLFFSLQNIYILVAILCRLSGHSVGYLAINVGCQKTTANTNSSVSECV